MNLVDVRLTRERADRGREAYIRNVAARKELTLPCVTPGCSGKINQLSKIGKCRKCSRLAWDTVGVKREVADSVSQGWLGAGHCLGGLDVMAAECELVWGDLDHRHCPGPEPDFPCGEPVAGYWGGLCGHCALRALPLSQVKHSERPLVETPESNPHHLLRPVKAAKVVKPSDMLTSDAPRVNWSNVA
jgi:hypothetical protein